MNTIRKAWSVLLFPILVSGCEPGNQQAEIKEEITHLQKKHAPDKRVALFEVEWKDGKLTGETDLPEAHLELLQRLDEKNIGYKDEIKVLPEPGLGNQTQALVTLSVANIRSQPKHSAELATQALMGTALKVLKKQDSWYLVQTPDKYISWVDAAGIHLMTATEMQRWVDVPKLVCTEMIAYVYQDDELNNKVSDITAGNILEMLGETPHSYTVMLPDGRKGHMKKTEGVTYENWVRTRLASDENLIRTAKDMMGAPYLWGGTSPKGVDCSGFTKTIYFLNGMVIPRDASQQVNEGEEIDHRKDWSQLQVGDLLFFGTPATESSPERVVHVGMWIGNKSFIHSRGRVRISSFDPGDENFDEYELNRYLRTKRIRNHASNNIFSVKDLTFLL
ncbi:NlpC/P60 family protein [Negadavirga shengliensis]|uniref:NlpC/P60 family protein n=1 Tax=Negadavirga shengliensis TaxID=1389218 RepID=A0ABV9T5E3_9BACT